jgi:hypothetical protein
MIVKVNNYQLFNPLKLEFNLININKNQFTPHRNIQCLDYKDQSVNTLKESYDEFVGKKEGLLDVEAGRYV